MDFSEDMLVPRRVTQIEDRISKGSAPRGPKTSQSESRLRALSGGRFVGRLTFEMYKKNDDKNMWVFPKIVRFLPNHPLQ